MESEQPWPKQKFKRGRNQKKGLVEVEPTFGCRDFYPQQMRLQRWLFDNFRSVASLYGFQVSEFLGYSDTQEYDAPIVEAQELYLTRTGEEIVDQLFLLPQRMTGKSPFALK
jgi:histidyl-tRNA synthetase